MEAALVTVSTGVMKTLLSKLTDLLGEEYVKLKGVRKQIKFLRDELSAMSPTLDMLADAEQLDPNMREWRDKLRELAYDLEDCVDVFVVRVDHKRDGLSVLEWFSHELNKLKARHDLANQIEELKARVIETSDRHKRYDLTQLKNKPSSSSVDPRLQALYEDIDNLVGTDGPKKHIIDLLTMEANGSSVKLKVVSISGCGGLGKTTIAKQVYDDIKSQFQCAAFVSVSRIPDVRKILVHIADGVKCPSIITQDDDEQQLIDKLREHLHDKRYIVVIDDVWEVEAWESIKFALPNNDLRSRIITTTRSLTVAKYSSSQVYEMVPLSFDDSKRLFFKRSIGSENPCYSHLDDVPDRILRRCGGLPLAIVTVSSMLINKHAKAEWDRVLNEIGSALANKTDAKKMTSILSLSFFDIPHRLRTCLLYLSVFPEDHEIEKQRLINRWIAEGFIHEEERRTKYEIGEGYFNDLINRSMIQPVNVEYGQAKACRVHDMILDYIKCKAAEENFVTSLDGAEPEYKYKVRRLCVSNHSEENVVTLCVDQILSHVRSVTVFGQPVKISLLPSIALRVLDLDLGEHRGMKYHQVESIGKLFNLKYLRLYSRSITKLPENVGQLQHLQTLDVRGTRIKELPPTIVELRQLAHLYVNWHAIFPAGVIRMMLSLEEMREYGVLSYEQGQSLLEFSKLTKLRTLKMRWDFNLPDSSEGRSQAEGIHNYVGNLLSSCDIHNLYITQLIGTHPVSLDSWHSSASCNLRKLCIRNCPIYRVPNWMCSHGNLSVLELMIICVRPEDVEILGKIPSLIFLNISTTGGTNGRIIVHGKSGFRSLKYFSLDISVCGTILEFEVGSMPNVECVNLALIVHEMDLSVQDDDIFWAKTKVAPSLGIHHLSTLNKVEIKICGDTIVRWVSRVINDAIETLPNCPIVRITTENDCECKQFESVSYLTEQQPLMIPSTSQMLPAYISFFPFSKYLAVQLNNSLLENGISLAANNFLRGEIKPSRNISLPWRCYKTFKETHIS